MKIARVASQPDRQSLGSIRSDTLNILNLNLMTGAQKKAKEGAEKPPFPGFFFVFL
ncbi:hypothetical protein [Paenibacillus xylanexedens]|uniref:hypothetical protein n=1 Tax=Paenibacillus xylanexedens TaxID=528191 RepID=UPI00164382DC|nr:hypothetical protein [Paenibacillus xylanexedens]